MYSVVYGTDTGLLKSVLATVPDSKTGEPNIHAKVLKESLIFSQEKDQSVTHMFTFNTNSELIVRGTSLIFVQNMIQIDQIDLNSAVLDFFKSSETSFSLLTSSSVINLQLENSSKIKLLTKIDLPKQYTVGKFLNSSSKIIACFQDEVPVILETGKILFKFKNQPDTNLQLRSIFTPTSIAISLDNQIIIASKEGHIRTYKEGDMRCLHEYRSIIDDLGVGRIASGIKVKKCITKISIHGNFLFVADNYCNIVYYDLPGILSGNLGKRVALKGLEGSCAAIDYLDGIICIGSIDRHIYLYSGKRLIGKIYTKQKISSLRYIGCEKENESTHDSAESDLELEEEGEDGEEEEDEEEGEEEEGEDEDESESESDSSDAPSKRRRHK
jgi:hypothetical protein